MPVFSSIVSKAVTGGVPGGKPSSIDATMVMIGGKEIGFQFMSGEMAQELAPGVSFPQLACLCGRECNLDSAKVWGNRKGKEDYTCRCSSCGFRMVGSAGTLLSEACKNKYLFMKLRFCSATKKPMTYMTMRAAGVFEVQCGYMQCSCIPLQLVDLICDDSECTTLGDETIEYLRSAGFSRILQVPAERRHDSEAFEKALRSIDFFSHRKPAKKAIVAKEVSDSEEEKPKKKKTVKQITKAKPKPTTKKVVKKTVARDFIDDEAEEGSETEASEMEEDAE